MVGISPRTGDREWSLRTQGLEPVAGDDELIALASPALTGIGDPHRQEAVIRVVDRAAGELRWTTELGTKDDRVLAVAFTTASVAVVVGKFDSRLDAIESSIDVTRLVLLKRADGTVRSEMSLPSALGLPMGSGQRFAPGLTGAERLVLVWSERKLAALDPRTGDRKWSLSDYAWVSTLVPRPDGRPVLFADHFQLTPNGRLIDRRDALGGRTGRTLWTVPRDHFVVAAEGDTTVVLPLLWHDFGTALVVDTQTGQARWTHSLSDDQSIVAGTDSLFVGGGCPTTGAD
jgi:outer membrane protein assembly factor BamB